ncbi:hypothetical protein BDZ89DRAFT_1209509 [Hymenopellis radicata]|nr:hypothetical protein BDZ89DRAFT_1209509 [Hymenopellis radicata]
MPVDYNYHYFAPEAEATATTSASSSSPTDTKPPSSNPLALQKLPALATLQSSMFIDLDSEEWDDNLGRWIAGSRRAASAKAKLQSSYSPSLERFSRLPPLEFEKRCGKNVHLVTLRIRWYLIERALGNAHRLIPVHLSTYEVMLQVNMRETGMTEGFAVSQAEPTSIILLNIHTHNLHSRNEKKKTRES